jgi:hypothetical protein
MSLTRVRLGIGKTNPGIQAPVHEGSSWDNKGK